MNSEISEIFEISDLRTSRSKLDCRLGNIKQFAGRLCGFYVSAERIENKNLFYFFRYETFHAILFFLFLILRTESNQINFTPVNVA